MEDRISGGLQHCHETCCEKGGYCGRQACMVQRWFHCWDVVSRQVDLYMTQVLTIGDAQSFSSIVPIALSRGFSSATLIEV